MIYIKTIDAENFMNLKSVHLDFTEAEINIFFGENGEGKSTILETMAICFIERKRGDSYKDYIRLGEMESEINLTAKIGAEDIIFNIILSKKKGHTPFSRQITYKGVTYKNSECKPLLHSFGLDYLQHVMFSLQGVSNITSLKPKERTDQLKKIFDIELQQQLDILDTSEEKVNNDLITNNSRYKTLQEKTFKKEVLINVLSDAEVKKLKKTKSETLVLIDNLASLKYQAMHLQEKVTSLEEKKKSILVQIDKTKQEKIYIQNSLLTTNNDLESFSTRLNDMGNKAVFARKIKSLENSNKVLTTTIEALKERLTKYKKELPLQQKTLGILASDISTHKKGVCSLCGQSVPKPEKNLDVLEKEYTEVESNIKRIEKEIGNIVDQINEKEKTQIRQEHELTTLTTTSIQNEKDKEFFTQRIVSLEESKEELLQRDISRTNYLNQLNEDIVVIENDFTKLELPDNKILDKIAELQKIVDSCSSDITSNEVNIKTNESLYQRNKDLELQEIEHKKTIEKLQININKCMKELSLIKEARSLLKTDLPNYIIVKACHKLESTINQFIANVEPGMKVRLLQSKSGVEFFYLPKEAQEKEEWMSTKMASGFEIQLLTTSWIVALAKAYGLKVLVLDEIESASSVDNSDKLFRELANVDGFDQMFIISHKPNIVNILKSEKDKVDSYLVANGTFTKQIH